MDDTAKIIGGGVLAAAAGSAIANTDNSYSPHTRNKIPMILGLGVAALIVLAAIFFPAMTATALSAFLTFAAAVASIAIGAIANNVLNKQADDKILNTHLANEQEYTNNLKIQNEIMKNRGYNPNNVNLTHMSYPQQQVAFPPQMLNNNQMIQPQPYRQNTFTNPRPIQQNNSDAVSFNLHSQNNLFQQGKN